MTFGVTPEGFTRPTVQEVKESLEREQIASIDPTLDVATDPVVGQLNAIFSQHLGKAWEALETSYGGFDRDKAEGVLLVSLGKLSGTTPRGATYSLVVLTCNFANAGVTLEAGVHFANVEDRPDIRWTPIANFTSTASGGVPVTFRAENTGPVAAGAFSINVIATPVTGWNTVTNLTMASAGRNVETDAELRLRQEEELAKPGSARIKAIKADLLEIDEIEEVTMFENRTGLRDNVTGLPPHSFEACIWAGDPLAADTAEIAQAIWDSKAGGAQPFGDVSGFAETGEDGADALVLVFFRLATVRNVFLTFDIVIGPDYVGDTNFKLAIATVLNTMHRIGKTVVSERIQALAFDDDFKDFGFNFDELGIEDLATFAQGFAASPTEEENLPVGSRDIARFDTGRIIVNHV